MKVSRSCLIKIVRKSCRFINFRLNHNVNFSMYLLPQIFSSARFSHDRTEYKTHILMYFQKIQFIQAWQSNTLLKRKYVMTFLAPLIFMNLLLDETGPIEIYFSTINFLRQEFCDNRKQILNLLIQKNHPPAPLPALSAFQHSLLTF